MKKPSLKKKLLNTLLRSATAQSVVLCTAYVSWIGLVGLSTSGLG